MTTLNPEQLKLITILANPDSAGRTMDDIAAEVGRHRRTLYKWLKQPAVTEELKRQVRALLPARDHAAIVKGLIRRAKMGDQRAVRTYLEWTQELQSRGININQETNVITGPPQIEVSLGDSEAGADPQLLLQIVRLAEKGMFSLKDGLQYIKNEAERALGARQTIALPAAPEPPAPVPTDPDVIDIEVEEATPQPAATTDCHPMGPAARKQWEKQWWKGVLSGGQ